jgi:hypothetical protein
VEDADGRFLKIAAVTGIDVNKLPTVAVHFIVFMDPQAAELP